MNDFPKDANINVSDHPVGLPSQKKKKKEKEMEEGIIMCPSVESAISNIKQTLIHLTGITVNRVLYKIAAS